MSYNFIAIVYFCSMNSDTGNWSIVVGIIVVPAGLIIYFFHDKLHWIGRLPGDIRIGDKNFRFCLPIATMVIFSLLLTLIMNSIKKFLR
ncbi:MAG: DUF2905 domain-containing protein [Ferruginibacter sp.]